MQHDKYTAAVYSWSIANNFVIGFYYVHILEFEILQITWNE